MLGQMADYNDIVLTYTNGNRYVVISAFIQSQTRN